jgi:DNA-binding NtrC family response regulator
MPSNVRPPFEVLIVDDDQDICEILVEFFRGHGYQCAQAGDGRAAVVAIERSPSRYGLIFADLQLPGADGLDVLRAARTHNPSAYVVIMTGYATLDSAIQAVRLGAYDYLTKPFSLGQIDVIVGRLLNHRTLDAENRDLSRLVGATRDDGQREVAARLDAIDMRLGRLEAVLRGQPRAFDRA